jgi:hypothetical protein
MPHGKQTDGVFGANANPRGLNRRKRGGSQAPFWRASRPAPMGPAHGAGPGGPGGETPFFPGGINLGLTRFAESG